MKRRLNLYLIILAVLTCVTSTAEAALYTFTTADVPGSSTANGSGVNNSGNIVGFYNDSPEAYSFHDGGGGGSASTHVAFSGAGGSGAAGNNGLTNIGGQYPDNTGNHVGKTAVGIDNSGSTVERYLGSRWRQDSLDGEGSFSFFDVSVPDSDNATAGIHKFGTTEWYIGSAGHQGFFNAGGSFSSNHGTFLGTGDTGVTGNKGFYNTVGDYGDNTLSHGFHDVGWSFNSIDIPGALSTNSDRMNDSGQIMGPYSLASAVGDGFIPTAAPVPEPSTMLLLGSGLLGLWELRRKFRA